MLSSDGSSVVIIEHRSGAQMQSKSIQANFKQQLSRRLSCIGATISTLEVIAKVIDNMDASELPWEQSEFFFPKSAEDVRDLF
jgi:hypothetical protein